MTRRLSLLSVVAVVVALLLVSSAIATGESTKAYVMRVEPICKANTPAIEHLLTGTRAMANHGKAVAAGRRFVRASSLFALMVRRIAAVRRPAPEAAVIARWLDKLRDVKQGLRKLGRALKHRDRLGALNRVGRLRDAGTAANHVVRGFHFRYCKIYQSRFS
jgi:hypothetical protein